MLRHHILISLRILNRYKVHSLINIVGLSIGIAGAILSILFVMDEFSFDRFHTKGDRIFRINKLVTLPDGSTEKNAESSGLLGPTLQIEQAEIEKVVRFRPLFNEVVLSMENKNYVASEGDLAFTDSTFFSVFDFHLLEGDPSTALTRPATIVITEAIAESLFGNISPIGKSIKGLEGQPFEITGVLKSLPRNSQLQFKALISWSTTTTPGSPLFQGWMNRIVPQGLCTYLLLNDPAHKMKIEMAFPPFMEKHMPEQKDRYAYYLQPFLDTYLHSSEISGLLMSKVGSINFIRLLSIITGFILVIACINYLNISIAHSARRAKEVGMRKSIGASHQQMFSQFMGESFTITWIAALFSLVLVACAIQPFNELLDKSLSFSLLLNIKAAGISLLLIVIVSFLAGAYPALVMSSVKPVASLKGLIKTSLAGKLSRHLLILVQFFISISIISATFLVYQQVKLVLSRDLGFDKEHVLVINMSRDVAARKDVFADELRILSGVEAVSVCNTAIGSGSWSTMVIPEGFNSNEVESRMFGVDFNFAKAYGLKLRDGRFFDPQRASDSLSIIINEAMLKRLHWDNAMDKGIKFSEAGPQFRIIGVTQDFHFKSLYEEIEPVIMFLDTETGRSVSVRFTGNPNSLLTGMEKVWKTFEAQYPFTYYVVDAKLKQAYQSEQKLLTSVLIFGGISILLACLGLYGVISFMLEQRIKEIGMRRVLGASMSAITMLISQKFIFIILAAGLLSVPVVVWQINGWLSRFIIKIDIGFFPFAVSIILIAVVAASAMAIQIWKVGRQSPTILLK